MRLWQQDGKYERRVSDLQAPNKPNHLRPSSPSLSRSASPATSQSPRRSQEVLTSNLIEDSLGDLYELPFEVCRERKVISPCPMVNSPLSRLHYVGVISYQLVAIGLGVIMFELA